MNLANTLTLIRIGLTPVFVVLYMSGDTWLRVAGITVFFTASLTDWYDGYYARKTNTVTRVGQFMDPLADKVLNLTATAILAYHGHTYWWIVGLIVIRDLLVTGLRLYALMISQPVITSRTAQWKTFIHMGLIGIVMLQTFLATIADIHILDTGASYTNLLGIAWLITAGLSVYTSIDYSIDNVSIYVRIWRSLMKRAGAI